MNRIRAFCGRFFDKTFWKFLLVGVANTLFGTAVMFVFYNVFHLSYWFSSASNYVLGSVLSYILNKTFTFQNRANTGETLLRFAVNIALCYLAAYGLAKPIVYRLMAEASVTLRDNAAMLAGMCLFVALNYCGQRFFVFRGRRQESPREGADGPEGKPKA